MEKAADVVEQWENLADDRAWQQTVRRLLDRFGYAPTDGEDPYLFALYSTPAGAGKRTDVKMAFRQGLWQSFDVHEGPSWINTLLADRCGRVWCGSRMGGLSYYDGAFFTAFGVDDGLIDIGVACLLEDRQGVLWIGTWAGLIRYDGETFRTFTTADGLGANRVASLMEDPQGQLWVGTRGGGVSCFNGRGFRTFTAADGLASDWVGCMLAGRQGQLWFGSGDYLYNVPGAGVSCYDGTRWRRYTAAEGLADNDVRALFEDRQGRIWIGTRWGASRWDGRQFTGFDALASTAVGAIAADDAGQLWFSTDVEGVRCFDGHSWRAFTSADGLINDQVLAIVKDAQGHLYFGTTTGLTRRDQGAFTHFTNGEGLVHNGVTSLFEDRQGQLWIGTQRGVSCWDGEQFKQLEGLVGWNIWAGMEDRHGQLWFGGSTSGNSPGAGVVRYDGTNIEGLTSADGLPDNDIFSLLEDRRGHIWIGSRSQGGVSRWDGQQFQTFTKADGLGGNRVRCLLEDRHGTLWIGTSSGGLSRWDGRKFRTFTRRDGVADSVGSLLEDSQGYIWLGTWGRGLCRWDGQQFRIFSSQDGLVFDRVSALLEDSRGHIWIGTYGGGVSRYDGCVFQALTRRDGLIHDAVQALCQDRQGDIWIGTEGGLTRYRPASMSPTVAMEAVVADRRWAPSEVIVLAANQQLVRFAFQGRSLTTSPERMAYVYRLQGYNANWQPVYSNRVEYQGLPEGDYTFQVKAVDRDLNYSEMAEVKVSVEPDALVKSLTAALDQAGPTGEFVGRSAALQKVQAQLEQVAPVDLTVLILGETGTGKGLAARTLHRLSPRKDQPFIPVNCGALPEALIESELFGHEKGAFTGASSRRLGKVELAQGGTLFLDEIGDMPLMAQVKLLQLLEERTFERVGGTQVLNAEVRVVAATNRDLDQMLQAGSFRQDLYFRLQGFELQLPPLRDRQEDIPLLALYFIGPKAAHLNKEVTGLSKAAEEALVAHAWPGNVRELQHAIERAVVACRGAIIQLGDLMLGRLPARSPAPEGFATLQENERRHIQAVLDSTGGRISGPKGAATILGIPESTLRNRMKILGMR